MGEWCVGILSAILVVALTLLIIWFVLWNVVTSWKRKFLTLEGEVMHFVNQSVEFLSNLISGDKIKVAESLHSLMKTIEAMIKNLPK